MKRKFLIAAAVAGVVVITYGAMPYFAIWQIMNAVRSGDVRTFAEQVDWDAVRSGIKIDIARGIMGDLAPDPVDQPAQRMEVSNSSGKVASDSLPPFGASFINGIAGSVVDRDVTAEHVAAMLHQVAPADGGAMSLPLSNIKHAFFNTPTSFELSVLCPGQDPSDEPLRIRMKLRGTHWTIVRAWIPQDLVDLANSRT